MHQKHVPEDWMRKKTQKMEKLSGRDCEFQESTLRREYTVKRENLSRESHGEREEFQLEETKDDEGITKDFWAHAEARKEFHLSSSYWTEKFNLRAERRNHSLLQDFYYWTKLIREYIYGAEEDMRKAKTFDATQIQWYWYCREGWNSVLCYNFTQEFVPMKRSQESSSPNFLWRWKQAHVVPSRGTAYLWNKILQVNFKIRWVQDTLKWELGKKEVWTPNVVLFSALRESRVAYGSEDSGDLSLRDACLGKPRSKNKRSFFSSNIDSRCKGDNGKGMKGGHEEGTQKQK